MNVGERCQRFRSDPTRVENSAENRQKNTDPSGPTGSKDPFAKLPAAVSSVGSSRRSQGQRNGPLKYSNEMCIRGGKNEHEPPFINLECLLINFRDGVTIADSKLSTSGWRAEKVRPWNTKRKIHLIHTHDWPK